MKQDPIFNSDKEPLDPHMFSHKSHPDTKIVKSTGEECCPFNGQTDERGSPVGPNIHYETAHEEMMRQLYRTIEKKYS